MTTFKAFSLAGLGVLGAGAVGAGGIAMSVGGGTDSKETAKPTPAPTLSQRLSDRGYQIEVIPTIHLS